MSGTYILSLTVQSMQDSYIYWPIEHNLLACIRF